MSWEEFKNVTRTPARLALDMIRKELGMDRQKNPCPECGDERWEVKRGIGKPVEHCESCSGKRVVAENILRVIRDYAREGLSSSRIDNIKEARP